MKQIIGFLMLSIIMMNPVHASPFSGSKAEQLSQVTADLMVSLMVDRCANETIY